jgi:restriction endonuclease S subunit
MIIKTVEEIFFINQGHQITEEEIYNSSGDYPIFTGNNHLVGYVDTSIVETKELPCICYPTKGNVGKLYVKNELFEANNMAVLTFKEEWIEKVDLYWFIFYISPRIKKFSNSKNGVGYIGKDIMERISVKIPDIEKQKTISSFFLKTQSSIHQIEFSMKKLKKNIYHPYQFEKHSFHDKIGEFFYILGGNSGLTKEFVYNNQPKNETESILIHSGATIDENLMGSIAKNSEIENPKTNVSKKIKTFNGPAILVVRKGLAGHMNYITDDLFTINDDAYVIIPKDKYKDKINLRWFINQYQDLFYKIASHNDNATFNKTYASEIKIKIPDMDTQNKISESLLKVDDLINNMDLLKLKLEKILEYDII